MGTLSRAWRLLDNAIEGPQGPDGDGEGVNRTPPGSPGLGLARSCLSFLLRAWTGENYNSQHAPRAHARTGELSIKVTWGARLPRRPARAACQLPAGSGPGAV